MAKKKIKLKSIFKAKLTKAQIIFSSIFIIILFTSLVLFFLSNPTGLGLRAEAYSSFLNMENNVLTNFTTFSIPTPTPKPIYTPQATPIPTSILPSLKLSEIPDELKVSRSINQDPVQGHDNPLSYFRTISDPVTVRKLYNAILELPPPPKRFLGSCVAHPYLVQYDLTFFNKGNLVEHGTINILVGCAAGETVNLDGTYERQFSTLDKKAFGTFISVLESSFDVTGSQLYDMSDPNWLQMRGVPEKPL